MTTKELPVLNKEGAIARFSGDEELYREITAMFLDDYPKQVAKLKVAIAANDLAASCLTSHSLKSAAASVGAERASDVARQMEAFSKDGKLLELQNAFSVLEKELELSRIALVEKAMR